MLTETWCSVGGEGCSRIVHRFEWGSNCLVQAYWKESWELPIHVMIRVVVVCEAAVCCGCMLLLLNIPMPSLGASDAASANRTRRFANSCRDSSGCLLQGFMQCAGGCMLLLLAIPGPSLGASVAASADHDRARPRGQRYTWLTTRLSDGSLESCIEKDKCNMYACRPTWNTMHISSYILL